MVEDIRNYLPNPGEPVLEEHFDGPWNIVVGLVRDAIDTYDEALVAAGRAAGQDEVLTITPEGTTVPCPTGTGRFVYSHVDGGRVEHKVGGAWLALAPLGQPGRWWVDVNLPPVPWYDSPATLVLRADPAARIVPRWF